jgi:hypothetical protein
MSTFEKITPAEFCRLVTERGSAALRRQFARFTVADPARWSVDDCLVHRGPLSLTGRFKAPAHQTLILGDLYVEGLVDLEDSHEEGGVFVVLGHVECDVFSNSYGKCTFVDGHLEATELVLNAFSDSSLVVAGNLRTRFFYGLDIWAEVGGRVEMEYGEGYCLPIGYRDARREAIRPRHSIGASLALLDFAQTDELGPHHLLDAIRAGRPIFRPVRGRA